MKFSRVHHEYVYCFGLDNDVMCGRWKQFDKHRKGKKGEKHRPMNPSVKQDKFQNCFRANAKWVGVDVVCESEDKQESVVGLSESGMFYSVQRPNLLHPVFHGSDGDTRIEIDVEN